MTPAAFRRLRRRRSPDRRASIRAGSFSAATIWVPIRGKRCRRRKAMAEAREMVRAYVEAGFDKIHLDASMACADDGALGEATIAERARRTVRGGGSDGRGREGNRLCDRHRSADSRRRDGGARRAGGDAARSRAAHRRTSSRRLRRARRSRRRWIASSPWSCSRASTWATRRCSATTAKGGGAERRVARHPGVVFEAHRPTFRRSARLRPGRVAFRHPEGRAVAHLRVSRGRRRDGRHRGASRRVEALQHNFCP